LDINAEHSEIPFLHMISEASDNACDFGFVGTLAATPEVADIAALILEINPELMAREVPLFSMLTATEVDLRHQS
jgi:hypothetical protein